ncbi:MAG: hypothetical protein ACRBB0_01295 [Pelagimonas sp.]|uniref:hypothetical protein n=1 Tax=Pelagimonas sp. TaxID=2073170 RepID=UPI003D6BE480
MNHTLCATSTALFILLCSSASAATCPANAPDGYKWLSSYVEEFHAKGTVSDWFTDSLKKHPDDVALLALQAYFDAGGDTSAARKLHKTRGGSVQNFDLGMACAKIE